LESEPVSAEVRYLIDFIRASKRGVCFGPREGKSSQLPVTSDQ
jgi:hypothetical protein